MRRLFAFLSDMDAQAWRTLAVSFVLFGGVGVVFVFGAQPAFQRPLAVEAQQLGAGRLAGRGAGAVEIGRASCRERVSKQV